MKSIWVIVANAKNAYFYCVSERDMRFNLIKKLTHVESQLKIADLISDRQGHYAKGYGNKLRGSYSQMTNPKLSEIKNFVKEICQFLENGRIENCYAGIFIIANSHFYGLIKQLSNKNLIKYIKYYLDKDYANFDPKLLKPILKDSLYHELKLVFIGDT